MLTRGHLIGQIVDDLAGIAAQAKLRATLHLFDIHIYVEEFAKEVLNRALGLNLSNLNDERSNNPGLDLGDAVMGWAFQVTAEKTSAKVKETLEKIDGEQKRKFSNIRILVIGEKQGSYSFTGEPFSTFNFTQDMVWDFNDICSRIMTLKLDELVSLADYISRETRRVRVELEIPNEKGEFPTSIDALIESLPQPKLSNATKMYDHLLEKYDEDVGRDIAEQQLAILSRKLSKLPRLTREVFKFLIERRDEWTEPLSKVFTINAPTVHRIYKGDDCKFQNYLSHFLQNYLSHLATPKFHKNSSVFATANLHRQWC